MMFQVPEALAKELRPALEADQEPPFVALERAFGQWAYENGGKIPEIALLAAHALKAVRLGSTCLPAQACLEIAGENLAACLEASPLVGTPLHKRPEAPLVWDGERLYIRRYDLYEERLAQRLLGFLKEEPKTLGPVGSLFGTGVFGGTNPAETHWQAVAVALSERYRFVVLLGGPGTGKTYCVLLMMLHMIESALKDSRPCPSFQLAAPTGKAAARMQESILNQLAPEKRQRDSALSSYFDALESMLGQSLLEALPAKAITLHRLLGMRGPSPLPGRHAQNPIPEDVVIVDEVSMVDLPMISKLFEAIKPGGKLILVGDPHQLASVEVGSVLADFASILEPKEGPTFVNAFSKAQREALGSLLQADAPQAPPPVGLVESLSDRIVTLKKNWRVTQEAEILAEFARAINEGQTDRALSMLGNGNPNGPLSFQALQEEQDHHSRKSPITAIQGEMVLHYKSLFPEELSFDDIKSGKIASLLQDDLYRKKLLCAFRRGPLGSETLNSQIQQELFPRFRSQKAQPKPIIITHNDYRAHLYNGDTGLIVQEKGEERLWGVFWVKDRVEFFPADALPAHELAYAMTVHKAQGSEFDEIILLLPEIKKNPKEGEKGSSGHPLLTRELLYTAITRAKKKVRIYGSIQSIEQAISSRTQRDSGLQARIEQKWAE